MNVNAALRTKKCIAMLLAVALLFQCGVFAPIPARGATSAQASGQLMLGIHPVDYHQHLRDNGDGTYTLTLTLTDGATVSAGNLNNKVSYNNYFTAPDDGDYLIQLWGGNGGNGGSTYVEGEDGVGGAGGYVYGVVTLKEGQTLYYQLGGNGYTSSSVASGGGANGPGGNAGENQEWISGSTKPAIGGGGGYSAVYLFDKGEFEQYYLDANGNFLGIALSEDHRTSKHIMIAGGGGGGGYRADSDSSTPDGGVGGNMDTSASGATSDGGTFFSGTNGFTSGNSTAYVGEGGSDKPGAIKGTITSLYKGLQPNDWLRSYGTDTAGGSGGAGNFRGGGGGAGYAGGSGGVQTSALFGASNVGGGGGGSSYVSSLVRFGSDLTAAERAALTGIDDSPTGGYVQITALKVKDSTVLNSFSLSLSISDYFTVDRTDEALEAEDGILAINGNTLTLSGINLSGKSKVFTLKFTPKSGFAGGNAVPLAANGIVTFTSGSEAAQMKLDPKCASVNVPLNLKVVTKSYSTYDTNVTYVSTDGDGANWLHKAPVGNEFLSITGPAVSYTPPGGTASSAVNYIPTSNGSHIYDFIYTVSPKTAAIAQVGTPIAANRTISGTALVKILSATSQEVDEVESEPINGKLTLTITKNLEYVDGKYKLSINVQGDYLGKNDPSAGMVTGTATTPIVQAIRQPYDEDKDSGNNYSTHSYTVGYEDGDHLAPGYYYLQAWGGDGGTGRQNSFDPSDAHPGVGGYGAYLEGYIELKEGDKITIQVGNHGTSYAGNVSTTKDPTPGGGGGNYTKITLIRGEETTILMIAGGGGGGGGINTYYGFFTTNGKSGIGRYDENLNTNTYDGMYLNGYNQEYKENLADPNSITRQNELVTALPSDYEDSCIGKSGEDGKSNNRNNAQFGRSGQSYMNSSYVTQDASIYPELTADQQNVWDKDKWDELCNNRYFTDHRGRVPNSSDTDIMPGAAWITPILLNPTSYEAPSEDALTNAKEKIAERFQNYALSAVISQYFDITDPSVVMNNNAQGSTPASALTTTSLTVTPSSDNQTTVTISGISPTVTFEEDDTDSGAKCINASANYTIEIYLTPKFGFLGGNDVPLLKSSVLTVPAYDSDPAQSITLNSYETTDYANVAIDSGALGTLVANPNEEERTIDQDTTSIAQTALYQWISDWNTPSASWEDDYVELSISVAKKGSSTSLPQDQTIRPDPLITTVYTVTATISPKDTNADAAVVGPQDSHSISVDVEVIVVPRIHYDLTGVTTSDTPLYDNYYYGLTPGVSHIATLTAADGYDMPQSITVTDLYGNAIPDVSYNPNTGQFNIPGQYIEGTLTVTAVAKEKTYSISFWAPIGPDNELVCVKMGPSLKAGETIPDVKALAPVYGDDVTYTIVNPDGSSTTTPAVLQPADAEHYSGITWSPELNSLPANMPAQNIIIIGSFTAKEYPLTIQHVDNEGNTVADPQVVYVPYNEPYTASPVVISGYIPTQSSFTTTMDAEGKTIVFTYLPTTGQVIVNYAYTNGAYPDGSDTYEVVAGAPVDGSNTYDLNKAGYEITSFTCNNIASYTWVNGILTVNPTEEEIAAGITVNVTYQPKNYVLTFDPNGGNVSVPTMTVQYDNLYGYDALAGRTVGLPTPVLAGYDFVGWYIGETKITDADTVKITADTTLVAQWSQRPTYVTIRFEDELGNELYAPVKFGPADPGTSGSYDLIGTGAPGTSITKDGKTYVTREDTIINYTHGTTDIVIVVLYYAPKQLTINYRDAVTGELMDEGKFDDPNALNVYTALYYVGQEYTVQSPTATNSNNQADIAVVSGTMGTKDVVVNVLYTSTYQPPSYDITVVWNDMSFNYSYGNWDPTTHTYTPSVVPNSDNSITIRSNSTAEVNVTLSYTPYTNTQPPAGAIMDPSDPNYTDYDQYENLAGYYTAGENAQSQPITGVHLEKVDEQKVYFWLKIEDDGLPPGLENQSPIIGTCTVTIGATQSTP